MRHTLTVWFTHEALAKAFTPRGERLTITYKGSPLPADVELLEVRHSRDDGGVLVAMVFAHPLIDEDAEHWVGTPEQMRADPVRYKLTPARHAAS